MSKSKKEFYSFSYKEHFDSMRRRGWLAIKQGDANDTLMRWTNRDIGGANESTQKIEIGIWKDLENVHRDHDVHPVIKKTWGHSPELNGAGTEWFSCPIPMQLIDQYESTHDGREVIKYAKTELEKIFAKFSNKNKKRIVKLRKLQTQVVDRISQKLLELGYNQEVIAELAPRFGKTITFLSLYLKSTQQHETEILILPAYWLSLFTSFKNACAEWRDFEEFVVVDTVTDNSAESTIKSALEQKKKVVICVSLHGQDLLDWKIRHNWINQLTSKTMAVLDEADYGSHTENQREKIDYILENKQVFKIVTSGTNVQRMSKGVSSKVADYISIPYVSLEDLGEPGIVQRRMYQIFVGNRVTNLVEELSDVDAPAWLKILEKCYSQQSFLETFFQSVYGYQTQYGLDINELAEEDIQTSMVFVSCTKAAMEKLSKIIVNACPEHHVLVLNGDYTDNREAETLVKLTLRNIANGFIPQKKLIIIAKDMGSRSFSVGDIQATLFLLDGGSLDGFAQKSARCLDPIDSDNIYLINQKKFGHIFSFSLDRNRTQENVQLQVLKEAGQLSRWEKEQNSGQGSTMPEAMTRILNSVNLKRVGFLDELDVRTVTASDLLDEYADTEKLIKVAGVATDYEGILANEGLVELLLGMNVISNNNKTKLADILQKGRSKIINKAIGAPKSPEEKSAEKAIADAINSILGSSTTVLAQSNYHGSNFEECLRAIDQDPVVDENFQDLYGISAGHVLQFLPYLPVELLDIAVFNDSKAV